MDLCLEPVSRQTDVQRPLTGRFSGIRLGPCSSWRMQKGVATSQWHGWVWVRYKQGQSMICRLAIDLVMPGPHTEIVTE